MGAQLNKVVRLHSGAESQNSLLSAHSLSSFMARGYCAILPPGKAIGKGFSMPVKVARRHTTYGTYRGLTVYRFWDLPPGLLTPRQLKREGLAVAPRQRPRA